MTLSVASTYSPPLTSFSKSQGIELEVPNSSSSTALAPNNDRHTKLLPRTNSRTNSLHHGAPSTEPHSIFLAGTTSGQGHHPECKLGQPTTSHTSTGCCLLGLPSQGKPESSSRGTGDASLATNLTATKNNGNPLPPSNSGTEHSDEPSVPNPPFFPVTTPNMELPIPKLVPRTTQEIQITEVGDQETGGNSILELVKILKKTNAELEHILAVF
ncbi:hypothetical protein FXO37_02181 [Capsicum annuum]|nr:hypothetical protein FXO37_02181 [Capsicum annuum]